MNQINIGTVITASGVITAKEGVLEQIIVATDGTNSVTLSLYDNASAASGTLVIPTMVFTSSSVDRIQTLPVANKKFFNGLYASVTCSGTFGLVACYHND